MTIFTLKRFIKKTTKITCFIMDLDFVNRNVQANIDEEK